MKMIGQVRYNPATNVAKLVQKSGIEVNRRHRWGLFRIKIMASRIAIAMPTIPTPIANPTLSSKISSQHKQRQHTINRSEEKWVWFSSSLIDELSTQSVKGAHRLSSALPEARTNHRLILSSNICTTSFRTCRKIEGSEVTRASKLVFRLTSSDRFNSIWLCESKNARRAMVLDMSKSCGRGVWRDRLVCWLEIPRWDVEKSWSIVKWGAWNLLRYLGVCWVPVSDDLCTKLASHSR